MIPVFLIERILPWTRRSGLAVWFCCSRRHHRKPNDSSLAASSVRIKILANNFRCCWNCGRKISFKVNTKTLPVWNKPLTSKGLRRLLTTANNTFKLFQMIWEMNSVNASRISKEFQLLHSLSNRLLEINTEESRAFWFPRRQCFSGVRTGWFSKRFIWKISLFKLWKYIFRARRRRLDQIGVKFLFPVWNLLKVSTETMMNNWTTAFEWQPLPTLLTRKPCWWQKNEFQLSH